jgi:hypothetical protein
MTNGIEGLGVFKHTTVSTQLALSVHTVDTLETPTSTVLAVSGGVFIWMMSLSVFLFMSTAPSMFFPVYAVRTNAIQKDPSRLLWAVSALISLMLAKRIWLEVTTPKVKIINVGHTSIGLTS